MKEKIIKLRKTVCRQTNGMVCPMLDWFESDKPYCNLEMSGELKKANDHTAKKKCKYKEIILR